MQKNFVTGKVWFSRAGTDSAIHKSAEIRESGISRELDVFHRVQHCRWRGGETNCKASWLKTPQETIGYLVLNLALHIPLHALIKPTGKLHFPPYPKNKHKSTDAFKSDRNILELKVIQTQPFISLAAASGKQCSSSQVLNAMCNVS